MANSKRPAYPMYVRDFDGDEKVRGMSDAEVGMFLRCLNHAWNNEGLPVDVNEIERVLPGRRNHRQFSQQWRRVGACFVERDGRLINPRQEEERVKQAEFREERSRAGRYGNEKRWQEYRSAIPERSPYDHTASNQRIAKHRFASSTAIASAYTDPEASVTDSTVLAPNGELAPALIPIHEALRPHGEAIGREPDLELIRRIVEASQNQPLTAASWIGKTWLRRFSTQAIHRQPAPESLAYWVTAIREEAAGGWRS